jgi:hypothetical protein
MIWLGFGIVAVCCAQAVHRSQREPTVFESLFFGILIWVGVVLALSGLWSHYHA